MQRASLTRRWAYKLLIGVHLALVQGVLAQGYDAPLTIQGLDRTTLQSAAARGAGGTSIGLLDEIGVMFLNPAGLQSLQGIRVSLGGAQQYTDAQQIQHYAPLKYYSNFSLLMEGLTVHIPDPDTSLIGVNPGDTVQRPFDAIGPNWSRSKDRGLPLQILLAIPFTIEETKFVVGVGGVEYADLHHYYQNNNVLSPSILSQRPVPIPRPPTDSLPVRTDWSQFLRSRNGALRGYGVALSGSISDKISVGVSAMILKGSTDDYEQYVGRGRLTFYTNYFRLDSLYRQVETTGTSEYRGEEFTFSGIYRGSNVSFGFALKPPTIITREYNSQTRFDTTGSPAVVTLNGQDEVRLPWRGTIGLAIVPLENLTLGLEYELRSFASAVYRQADGAESKPWLSTGVLHVGVSYNPRPWVALRVGVRGQAETFEPEGNPVAGEPVSYSIYSVGGGISFGGIRLNVTYEYALMKYQDVWGSAISLNSERRHTFVADLAYEIPWMW